MAEFVIGPLISIVKENASSYLLDQYKVMDGMEEPREILERNLPAILDVIEDAEEKGAFRPGVSAWLKALKKVAYEANDVFDEFKYEALRRDAKKKGHYIKFGMDIVSLFPSHNPIVFRYRMGKKLRRIVQSIEVLVSEMNAFGFTYRQQAPPSNQWRQTDSIMVDSEKDIVSRSRDEEKKKIVNILVARASSNKDIMVLPVVGMGGLGKTTFAQLIYNDPEIENHFELRRWCCVSDDFDARIIADNICNSSNNDREKALQNLQKEVSGKRYFIVLDDVWNEDPDKWGKLKTCINHGSKGSVVLTTTRNEEVARIMTMGIDEAYTHKLGILGKEFVQEIIMRKASNLPSNPGISEIVDKIVDRCHGFPLAARAFGSMLSTRTSMQEWKNILDKSNICNEKTGILPILKLSYADLPSHMKQCFAFCAIFPKDYEIDVDNLIQLWLAHDFIPLQQGEHLETVGKEIFKELCWRSFFQDVRKNYPNRYNSTRFQLYYRTTCKIHDLMHDIALSVMGNECVTITDSSVLKKLANTTSHLFSSQHQIEAPLHDFLKNKSATLQTLLFMKTYASRMVPHLSKHNSMRVLKLFEMEELPVKPRHFQHLRYLNLSGNTKIKELPEDISMMYNLQTLDLSHCTKLRRLPKYLKYMSSLRHLYTNGCRNLTYMPPDIGRVTCLQTLTYFVVSANSGCSSIRELQNLNLGGELELSGLENASVMHAKAASLGRKEQLSHLSLEWKNNNQVEEPECHKKVLDALKPHGRLQVLRIVGYKSTGLPKWMKDHSVLQNFTELYINGCTMCEEFPEFYRMNGLRILHLESLDRLLSFCSNLASMTFPALKELRLYKLVTLERWNAKEASEGAELSFPLLEKADISYCPKLRTLCIGVIFTTFPALRELELYDLQSLEMWGTEEVSEGEKFSFPLLEKVEITDCPKLTTFPEAPKVQDVRVNEDKIQLSLSILQSNCMSSLSELELCISNAGEATLQFNQDRASTISKLKLVGSGCAFFFPSGPSRTTVGIWKRFGQLVDLKITSCSALINWPVEEFLCLVSLKNLLIGSCENLVGHPTQVKGEPTRQASRDQLLPHLNSLLINNCSSLKELFLLPPSLTRIQISSCPSLEFIWGNKEDNESESVHAEQRDTWTTPLEHCNDHASTSAPEQSSSPTTHPVPCLEYLQILFCNKLEALPYLPASLKALNAICCDRLCSVSGQLDALKNLYIKSCNNLEALDCLGDLPSLKTLSLESCKRLTLLPTDPESYSSLETVTIKYCPAINMKPLYERIQQGLDRLEERDLSHAHSRDPAEGPKLRYPKSWKYAIPGCR